MFPDFGEKTVKINHHGKIFIVPKLSILQYSHVIEIINESEAQMHTACEELWLLLETVLPEDILRDRDIFEYSDLVELCLHLAFGTYLDDKIKETGKDYYEVSTLPDYQFKATRILSQFSGYTLEKLLNEPASIFLALSDYTERINADNAIELIAEGVKAAFNNFEQLIVKRGSLTILNQNCTQADVLRQHKKED